MPTGIYKRTKPAWNKGRTGFKLAPSTRLKMRETALRVGSGSRLKKRFGNKERVAWQFLPEAEMIRKKMSEATKGDKNHAWRGDNVGYRALHYWVRGQLGLPLSCEHCGKEKTTPKSIHWANKSQKYLREKFDWIALCAKCHAKYDKTYA